ncbi:hypothetical protein D3C71_718950 [compost metagenome]
MKHGHMGGASIRHQQNAPARQETQPMGVADATQLCRRRVARRKKLIVAVERDNVAVVVADRHPFSIEVQRHTIRNLQPVLHEKLRIQMGKTGSSVQQVMGHVMGKAVAHPQLVQARAQIPCAQASWGAQELRLLLADHGQGLQRVQRGQTIRRGNVKQRYIALPAGDRDDAVADPAQAMGALEAGGRNLHGIREVDHLLPVFKLAVHPHDQHPVERDGRKRQTASVGRPAHIFGSPHGRNGVQHLCGADACQSHGETPCWML